MKKESLQVRRDPSCILIAFVLPVILLFIFGFGLSLDAKHVRLGFVGEDFSPAERSLWRALVATEYLEPIPFENRDAAEEALIAGRVRGVLVVPGDFAKRMMGGEKASLQLLTDGVETNTATILENYVLGVVGVWYRQLALDRGITVSAPVDIQMRVLFNPELESRYVLVPGSVVLIMALIGTLLTSLVVAREWERGTMEAMLATPIGPMDMILGKLIPYYILGISSTMFCTAIAVTLFHVPFRGSVLALLLAASAFLLASLALGFLISTVTKNQFLASQLALVLAFLPNLVLSGGIFEIGSMPWPIRIITRIFPARYFVTCLQTIFLAGDVWSLFVPNMLIMLLIAAILFTVTILKTPKRLE